MGLKRRSLALIACVGACVAVIFTASSDCALAVDAPPPAAPPLSALPTAAPDILANPEYKALFDQMFANPTNLDVTFRFAEMATQLGDYEAAIGALERMLFFNPDLPRVKLELGVLYFKLGSYAMAQYYFKSAISGRNVPAEVRAKVDAFLAEIAKRLSPTKLAIYAYTGLRYQTNADAGPDGLLVHVLGFDAVLNSQFAKRSDWNWFYQTEVDYAYDLGDQRGDSIEATFVGYYADQFTLHQFDLGIAELQVGPRIPFSSNGSVKVYAIGNALSLGDAPYLFTAGAGISTRFFLPWGMIEPFVEYRHRDYDNSTFYPTASEQTGNLVDVAVNINSTIADVHWLSQLYYNHNRVVDETDFGFNSYDQLGIEFGVPIAVPWHGAPSGWIVTPRLGGSQTNYAVPDPIVDPNITRIDSEIHFGGTLEGPLYKNIGLKVQVQDSIQHSTLPNYDLRDFQISFGPTVRY